MKMYNVTLSAKNSKGDVIKGFSLNVESDNVYGELDFMLDVHKAFKAIAKPSNTLKVEKVEEMPEMKEEGVNDDTNASNVVANTTNN